MAALTAACHKLMLRQALNVEEIVASFDVIASGQANAIQLGAFLALLHAKGETGEEIAAIAKVMRAKAVALQPMPSLNAAAPIVDIVGTGGDGHNTVNISTAAAILASSMGVRIAKHGNRSASSASGTADVLEALGVPYLSASTVGTCIDQVGIGFIFAPLFHPALAHVGPVRKQLGVRTVFNILGPLLNPAYPRRMVLGVYSESLLDAYIEATRDLGAEHVFVAHCGGLDEFATVATSHYRELKNGTISAGALDPGALGVKTSAIADLVGGNAQHNAKVLRDVLGGDDSRPELGDTIAVNAGAVLVVAGLADSLVAGFHAARAALKTGKAVAKLDEWVRVAQQLKQHENDVEAKKVKQ